MQKARICATIVESDIDYVLAVEDDVDFFEVRLDLVGPDWPDLVKRLRKPWLACNRSQSEGGRGSTDQSQRIAQLFRAIEAGASMVDLEYRTAGLSEIVPLIKRKAACLLSFHDQAGTPPYDTLVKMVEGQLQAGADICKIVTLARRFEDNMVVLKLLDHFRENKLVAFNMGEAGRISRLLSPLAGGYFTYAALAEGKQSASGQMTVKEMREIYRWLR
jgi:3-dehydroquinate dehydratase type I